MATIIEQQPLYDTLPVGQEVIYTVSNSAIVSTKTKVKFIARVYVSDSAINISSDTPIGTFKTTPNNAGVGMFDFRPVLESYVSADNQASDGSPYKVTTTASNTDPIPLHLIDKFSRNQNTYRYLAIEFGIEFLGATNCAGEQDDNVVREECGEEQPSEQRNLFNGYLKHTDLYKTFQGDFGYDTQKFDLNESTLPSHVPAEYLTNAPSTQYAKSTDYGTISFIATPPNSVDTLSYIKLTYTKDDGSTSTESVSNTEANGGYDMYGSTSDKQILYFGCFPANLRNWSSTFQALITAETLDYYTVQAYNANNNPLTERLTINLLCPNLKGYEAVRMCWLNQWGVWDYYTFTMKSTKMISTQGTTYQQQSGTWNESLYQPYGFKGGKKTFRVNATEKITMNTDFVSESESTWFEELINSPEAYILDGYQTDPSFSSLNTYATPVRLMTSSFTKKTIANDKLMQYTFEVEKSKTLRTQSI